MLNNLASPRSRLPAAMLEQLALPVIAAPMFLVSGPALVEAASIHGTENPRQEPQRLHGALGYLSPAQFEQPSSSRNHPVLRSGFSRQAHGIPTFDHVDAKRSCHWATLSVSPKGPSYGTDPLPSSRRRRTTPVKPAR